VGLDGLGKSASECLTLSVWTPGKVPVNDAKPVMVYFHGGDLTSGKANTKFGKLAAHGSGMVVVDVGYRLNLDGFLSVDAMVDESPTKTSGMFGLYDMLESLKWVQRNVAAFGGNPSKVTIWGQSSGGTAVMALLGSPLATGLFHGAMSLSGSPNISMSADVQRKQHQHIVDFAGCNPGNSSDVMHCLRSESTNLFGRLFKAEPKGKDHAAGTEESPSWLMANIFDIPRYKDGLRAPGLAVVDGHFLREPVIDAYTRVRNDVPVIFSTMGQECGMGPGKNVSALSAEEFKDYLVKSFSYVNASFGLQVADLYAPLISRSRQLAFDTMAADVEMACGNLALAEAAGQNFQKSPVYLLYNEQHINEDWWGSHALDLECATTSDYPFDNHQCEIMGHALRDIWLEFASTGKVSKWDPVTAAKPWATTHMTNDGTSTATGWKQKECSFWKSAGFDASFWWSN
jgi:carboxylesterase type B